MAIETVDLPARECKACHRYLPASATYFHAHRVSGFQTHCKECRARRLVEKRAQETDEARVERLQKQREANQRWRGANPERNIELGRKYYAIHGDRKREDCRVRAEKNRVRMKAAYATWKLANPERHKEAERRRRVRFRAAAKNRICKAISGRIQRTLRGGKAGRRWETLVGYTLPDLVAHIERQFVKGMSWSNYGKWHIDHILPVSMFEFSSETDDEFRLCWALSNLRPLWAKANFQKNHRRTHLI